MGKEIFVVTIVDALAAPLVFVDTDTKIFCISLHPSMKNTSLVKGHIIEHALIICW